MVYNSHTSLNFGGRARQWPTVSDVTDEFDFTHSFPYSIFSALRCICQQRGHWAPAYVMWRPPPYPAVSLSKSHSIQGTLAAKISVGCEGWRADVSCDAGAVGAPLSFCSDCRTHWSVHQVAARARRNLWLFSSQNTCCNATTHVVPYSLPECFAFCPGTPVKDCILLIILFLHSCFSSDFFLFYLS
jgi:hypothetical protein